MRRVSGTETVGGGVVALQAGVTYILHFTYAFYATYCSQHSHRSSSYTSTSLFSTLSYLPYHSSSSLDLAWLIFNIVSWFLFSLPLAPLLLFYFLSCHLLYAVSLSCRDLWSATCHHHYHHPLSQWAKRVVLVGHLHWSMGPGRVAFLPECWTELWMLLL